MSRLEELPPELVADAVARAVVEAVQGGGDTETMVSRALSRVRSELGIDGSPRAAPDIAGPIPAAGQEPTEVARPIAMAGAREVGARPVVTEADVRDAVTAGRGDLRLPRGTIVTALARDAARDAGVRLVEEG
jgi:hypothetical protein